MVSKLEFRQAAELAVQNIVKHGDTDIFPFPFENYAFFDKCSEIVDLVVEYDDHFEEYLARFSPLNVSSLTPVTYSGFRWATQIDPIWNAHFLACALALSKKMEDARAKKADNVVFSYRNQANFAAGDLFDRSYGWVQFMEHSVKLSTEFEFVVACDISEFYPRLGHHRIENALKQIAGETSLDDDENKEVAEIADRLNKVFDFSKSVVLRPMFPGCGYVDSSEGDVIFGSTLFEIKTVDRAVRSSDIRQTITYAALNAASASSRFNICGIGLFNPRRGQFCDIEIEHICSEISGRPAQELFEVIIQALSSSGISR